MVPRLKMPNLWRGESDAAIVAALDERHPGLRLVTVDVHRVIKGAFSVTHDGQFLGAFEIEVLLDTTDELGLPTVKEVGGRIPRTPDRHVNTADGSACLYLPEDLLVRTTEPLGIVEFLAGPVRNFFLGQLAVEAGEPFPFGEWGHGPDGLKEMLSGLFGVNDADLCLALLDLLSSKIIKAHWACPCRSGRALRDCHYRVVQGLRQRLPLVTRRLLATRAAALLRREKNPGEI